MRYRKLTGIILKKTNYREADQIVTVWTKEQGKVRCLAKGVRKPLSKLAAGLQDFSCASLELTGRHLPVLIHAAPGKIFNNLLTDLGKIAAACYAAELMLKLTADEHPNPQAFALLEGLLSDLDAKPGSRPNQVGNFARALISALGFGRAAAIPPSNDFVEANALVEQVLERRVRAKDFLTLVNS